jgi:hypothetical protein
MTVNYVPQFVAPTLDGSPITTRAIADINDPVYATSRLNVLDYGADPTGVADSSAAFSAAWVALKALRNATYTAVPVTLLIPPGVYLVGTSINWTGGASTFLAWNVQVIAEGAVIVGSCTGKAVIDMIGVRGLHIRGLHVYGSTTSIPACGFLYGPRNSETCGNNKFTDVKTTGYFSKAPAVNIGSETSQHIFCYYINENTDTAAYGYIADGLNRFGLTTDYSSIRAADVAVSFTNNRFIGCRFHKNTGGGSFWGEYLVGWQFDADCYFLAFSGANVTLRQSTAYRCANLRLNGLFETTIGDGVDYSLLVVQVDGQNSTMSNCEFNFATTHAEVATIKVAQIDGATDLTSGIMRFDGCIIRQSGNQSSSSTPMFDGAFTHFSGEIWCDTSTILNMGELVEFHGVIHTQDMDSAISLPSASSTAIVFERTRDIKILGLQNFANDAAAATGSIAVGGLYRNGSVVQIRVS